MELKDVLWTLLPLIMLIVVSWILSVLGSKVAKKSQEQEQLQGEAHGERSEELFIDVQDEELFEPSRSEPEQPAGAGHADQGQPAEWGTVQPGEPPPMTSEPIKPRWWGA
jgi:hypothetical protein